MKIIFGGSFNPVTKAHINIYFKIKELIDFSEFIFLPVSTNYHKEHLLSNMHRYNMLELATLNLEKVMISNYEFTQTTYLGTYHTLSYFRTIYEEDIMFVIGADNLLEIEHWINADKLLLEFKFIVLNREKLNIYEYIKNSVLSKYVESFIIIDSFDEKDSSSLFRTSKDATIVDEKVYEYIVYHDLYKE